ncbi:SDR family NAD(P)-dependent oxidoreductase [Thalassobaculum sp.]|uniref:SDR family NAD(P)-dependent oxidoreductase n=1 Tax=Thalassobaculum sp. TaxID=2022740 RepID=UPI003B5A4419
MPHPAIARDKAAVITGAASGIGKATAARLASLGMRVYMLDLPGRPLDAAREEVAGHAAETDHVIALPCDVSDEAEMRGTAQRVNAVSTAPSFLMNNAVTRVGGGIWNPAADWHKAVDVNLWGVVNGVRCFVPSMIEAGAKAHVVNVGSKQGITNPPGNTAYNVTKAAVKAYSEGLQHDLRNTPGCRVSAHLLIPGWTTTGDREHKPGAWLPDQVVDHMLAGLEAGDFYILCPDGETTPEMDRKRILWGAGDITENRPPLSRWDPAYKAAYNAFEP